MTENVICFGNEKLLEVTQLFDFAIARILQIIIMTFTLLLLAPQSVEVLPFRIYFSTVRALRLT